MKNTKIVLERPQKKLQLNGMILFIVACGGGKNNPKCAFGEHGVF